MSLRGTSSRLIIGRDSRAWGWARAASTRREIVRVVSIMCVVVWVSETRYG